MENDRSLGDRLRIRETIERYFFGVDSKDREVLVSCFSSNAEAEYHCTTPEQKIVVGGERIGNDIYASCSRFTCSTHCIANLTLEIAGDSAEANTYAIANVVFGGNMLIRGLRYQNRLSRTPQGWRIDRRRHTPMWQTEAAALPPKLF
jgi:SnoaL-like domain